MKAYGHNRFDKIECKYGCCTTKSGPKKDCRGVVDRQNRKSARQQGAKIICEEVRPE
jgi:hypothetical protein